MLVQHIAQFYVREPGFRHMQGGERFMGFIGPLVFLILIVLAMVLAYKAFTKHHTATVARDPLDIAKERFAKGEISKEELSEIRKELKS